MTAKSKESNQKNFQEFKKNVDTWVKEFDGKLTKIEHLTPQIQETAENTNHNYELIKEMQHTLQELKQEVSTVKKMQLLLTKSVLESNGRKVEKEVILSH